MYLLLNRFFESERPSAKQKDQIQLLQSILTEAARTEVGHVAATEP
jgi:hypothetical protein